MPRKVQDKEVRSLRATIDSLDTQLMELLAQRDQCVRTLRARKRAARQSMFDPERETKMLRTRRAKAEKLGLSASLIESMFRVLLAHNRGVQREDLEHFETQPPLGPRTQSFAALQDAVKAFNHARAWKRFHAPKNLAMALCAEAAELMEPMRWMTPSQSWQYARNTPTRTAFEHEMADVLIVLLSLASYLDVDLVQAARTKLELNNARYPVEKARGRAEKYTALAKK